MLDKRNSSPRPAGRAIMQSSRLERLHQTAIHLMRIWPAPGLSCRRRLHCQMCLSRRPWPVLSCPELFMASLWHCSNLATVKDGEKT